jgi:hypothetical protein
MLQVRRTEAWISVVSGKSSRSEDSEGLQRPQADGCCDGWDITTGEKMDPTRLPESGTYKLVPTRESASVGMRQGICVEESGRQSTNK